MSLKSGGKEGDNEAEGTREVRVDRPELALGVGVVPPSCEGACQLGPSTENPASQRHSVGRAKPQHVCNPSQLCLIMVP